MEKIREVTEVKLASTGKLPASIANQCLGHRADSELVKFRIKASYSYSGAPGWNLWF